MNKEKKEELKKLFSIIDEKKFLRFAKSYAGKDEAFADAIIEHFLPEDKPIDYKTVIAECFAHKKKGRASSWKLNYDWAVIRRESKRVMKQLQMTVDGGDYLSAIDGALLFLETLCKYFSDKLSKVRPEAHSKAVTLRDNLMRLYPKKPLFLSIMKELNL